MGCIDSNKSNPVYLVGHIVQSLVEIIRVKWGQCEVRIHIRIEKIVVEFYFTNNHQKKQTNKQKERKNQAYIMVELDLDDS